MNTAQPARAAAKKAPPQKSIVESMADVMRDMRAAEPGLKASDSDLAMRILTQ